MIARGVVRFSAAMATAVAMAGGCADGSDQYHSLPNATVSAPTYESAPKLDPTAVLEAWTPAGLVFTTTMAVSRDGAAPETHRIWTDERSGASLSVTLDGTGRATQASLVDSRLRLISVNSTGSREVVNLTDSEPKPARGVSLIPLLPAAGGLHDPRASWAVDTADPRGIVLRTVEGGPFSAELVIDSRTRLPIRYELRQGSEFLSAVFTDNQMFERDDEVTWLFDDSSLHELVR